MKETRNHRFSATLAAPFRRLALLLMTFFLAVALSGCCGWSKSRAQTPPADPARTAEVAVEPEDDTPVLVGAVERAEVEEAVPEWVGVQLESSPDAAAGTALTEVAPGAEVTVFLGTWCSDSRREVSRWWRALDDAGVGMMTELPFPVEYVAVDRDKVEPAGRLDDIGLEYVPTFIVYRDGEEVGRIVEISPHGIERDVLALLSGDEAGVISGREDLGGAGRDAILGTEAETDAPAEADAGR